MLSTHVYKILSTADWTEAQSLGETKTALDESDGYVHLSTREQVEETLRLYYTGQDGVLLLVFLVASFGDALKWEQSRNGCLFPHLYAPLRMDVAVRTWELSCDSTGGHLLPRDIES